MEVLLRPVTNRISSTELATSSSATYCTTGLRATGSISLGWLFVAGSRRVPKPAVGTMAQLITLRIYNGLPPGRCGKPEMPGSVGQTIAVCGLPSRQTTIACAHQG